ncbi:peptidoglycan-binding protein [Streptomyces sp. GC420]|uniref:peptidoglycan-binding protein n=1 Tax=Streptomyces sp. GC420 TaxID=2697568 RepID=UPI0014151D90|nr:peptidoglycan-binding protein [Streptomyces sp. GC420]NBM20528.1 helix-turn-helix domain-containing protein [Streptomyces sp. GC420]
MSRWKALPGSVDPRVRRLVVEMRRLKDHSGLGLAALAAKTPYSRSSWERYLNGKAMPPRQAVEALARVCGGDVAGLAALWEVAAGESAVRGLADRPEAGNRRPEATERAPDAEPEDGRAAEPPPRRRGRSPFAAAVLVGGLAVAVAVGLAVERPWRESPRSSDGTTVAAGPAPLSPPTPDASLRTYPCLFEVRDGLWYAGHSTTLTEEYGLGAVVEAVAEIQCLVQKHGFDPQGVDGWFGPNTKAAVRAFQRSRGLDDDGVVDPATWRELRNPDD